MFSSFSCYNFNTNWKKHWWCARDLNPGPQDGKHRQNHGAMAATQVCKYVSYKFVRPGTNHKTTSLCQLHSAFRTWSKNKLCKFVRSVPPPPLSPSNCFCGVVVAANVELVKRVFLFHKMTKSFEKSLATVFLPLKLVSRHRKCRHRKWHPKVFQVRCPRIPPNGNSLPPSILYCASHLFANLKSTRRRERESEVRGRKRNNFGRKLTKKCFFFKNKLQVVVVVDVVVVVIGLTSVARFRHVSKRSENYSNVFLKKIGPFPSSFSLFLSLLDSF